MQTFVFNSTLSVTAQSSIPFLNEMSLFLMLLNAAYFYCCEALWDFYQWKMLNKQTLHKKRIASILRRMRKAAANIDKPREWHVHNVLLCTFLQYIKRKKCYFILSSECTMLPINFCNTEHKLAHICTTNHIPIQGKAIKVKMFKLLLLQDMSVGQNWIQPTI